MRRAVKRLLSRLAPPPSETGVRVLLYHALGEPDREDRLSLRVSRDAFEAQMRILRDEGYRVVPLRQVVNGPEESAEPRVAITFDDGYASQLEAAALLESRGLPATFFVVTRFLSGRVEAEHGYWEPWPHFGWEDARNLARRGFEIGAHSASHRRLTRCGPVERQEEIAGVKRDLEDRLGQPVASFSYPHGSYNERVRRVVQAAGYRLACTSVCGGNRPPLQPFALRRIEISGQDRLEDFRQKLLGRYDWMGGCERWVRWRR